MNRVQKKCFVASACVHSSLVLVLLIGSAFKPSTVSLPVIEMVNLNSLKATDQLAFGGGTPAAATAAQSAPITAPPVVTPPTPVAPPPPQPAPQPVQEVRPPEPPKLVRAPDAIPIPEPKKTTKKTTAKKTTEPEKKKAVKETSEEEAPKRNLFAKPTTKKPNELKAAQEAAERQKVAREAQEAHQRAVTGSLSRLNKGLSSGVGIEITSSAGGFGGGGQAFANYAQIVKSVYDNAWLDPQDVSDERATVRASITISRDGNVVSFSILKSSGIGAMDRSVSDTLRRVKFIHEFPEGAKEQQRTFELNFNLKAKRLAG